MNELSAIAAKHSKLLLGFNAIILAATVLIIVLTPRTWTAQSELILPKSSSDLNANLGTLGNITRGEGAVFSQQLNPLKIISSIMTSNDALQKVWEKDPEKKKYPNLETYKKLFSVSPQSESTVLGIEVEGSTPELAKQRTFSFIETFQQRLNQLRADDASGRAKFLASEVEKSRQQLEQAQSEYNKYQESSELIGNDDLIKETLSTIKNLTTEKSQLAAKTQANEATIKELSSRLNLNPKEALQSLRFQENKQYQFLREQLSQVEAQLTAARAQFLDNSPQVESLIQEQTSLKNQLQKYGTAPKLDRTVGGDSAILVRELILAESKAKSARRGAEQIQKEIDILNARLKSLPLKQKQLSKLERQLKIAEGVYNGLVAQVQETKLNAFGSYPNIQLLDSPSVDAKRTKPKPKLIILGGILSALFGSAAIVLYFYERQPLLAIKDFKSSKLPILATIPHGKDTETVIEFEKLASAIDGMELENKCLMVTSTTAAEGKTTVSIGLATALTSLGYQVLLVDADYHQADLTKRMGYFDINPSALASLKAIRLVPKLDLLPTNIQDQNIAEYIAQGKFKEHLDAVQRMEKYDYIIIDSPPVSLTSEATMLARVLSNILFVVKPDFTERSDFNQSIEQLTNNKAEIIGLVVNDIDKKRNKSLYQKKNLYLPQENSQDV